MAISFGKRYPLGPLLLSIPSFLFRLDLVSFSLLRGFRIIPCWSHGGLVQIGLSGNKGKQDFLPPPTTTVGLLWFLRSFSRKKDFGGERRYVQYRRRWGNRLSIRRPTFILGVPPKFGECRCRSSFQATEFSNLPLSNTLLSTSHRDDVVTSPRHLNFATETYF